MRRPADTRGAELHLVLIGLHVGDQLLQVVRRQAVAPDQHERQVDGEHDRDEIGGGIVGRLFEQGLVLSERIRPSDDDGVAVRSGACRARGADRAAGAADVLDDDLLALRHPLLHMRATSRRPTMSTPSPGPNGTIAVMCLVGHSWAAAAPSRDSISTANATRRHTRIRWLPRQWKAASGGDQSPARHAFEGASIALARFSALPAITQGQDSSKIRTGVARCLIAQSPVSPAALITLAHFATSSAMIRAKSAGEPVTGGPPRSRTVPGWRSRRRQG